MKCSEGENRENGILKKAWVLRLKKHTGSKDKYEDLGKTPG